MPVEFHVEEICIVQICQTDWNANTWTFVALIRHTTEKISLCVMLAGTYTAC